jgi:hypothetical protein
MEEKASRVTFSSSSSFYTSFTFLKVAKTTQTHRLKTKPPV